MKVEHRENDPSVRKTVITNEKEEKNIGKVSVSVRYACLYVDNLNLNLNYGVKFIFDSTHENSSKSNQGRGDDEGTGSRSI